MLSSLLQLPTTPQKPAIQQYPTRTHFGNDITPASRPVALDARLTDDDVSALLQTAYPETELEDIQGNDKIMGQYFTCAFAATSPCTTREWKVLEKRRTLVPQMRTGRMTVVMKTVTIVAVTTVRRRRRTRASAVPQIDQTNLSTLTQTTDTFP